MAPELKDSNVILNYFICETFHVTKTAFIKKISQKRDNGKINKNSNLELFIVCKRVDVLVIKLDRIYEYALQIFNAMLLYIISVAAT